MRTLAENQMKWHRQQLKNARRAGLSDLENAHQLVVAIEALGKALHGRGRAKLVTVEPCLIAFSARSAPGGETEDPTSSPLPVMLKRVRDQRNDYAHEGTAARRLARQAAEVALQLERALLNAETKGSTMNMRDVMIAPVICAEGTDQNAAIHLYTHERACPEARSARGRGVSNNARARQRPWISAVSARADSRAA